MINMIKLYFKEHISLIVAVTFSCFIISGSLAWLERDFDFFYLGILYFFIFSIGMGIHFYRNIPLYKSILDKVDSKEDFFVFGKTPLAKAEQERIRSIRNIYNCEINHLKQENEHYKIIMSKWVHQMKTPISVLNLMTQEKQAIATENIIEEVDRMEYLLNQILHLIRMENVKSDFMVERCHLVELVKASINEQKNYFIQNEVFPKLDVSDSVYVYTDKKWFNFALQQFLNNAVKYSASHQSVKIYVECEHDKAILSIQDFGAGISLEDQSRIFDFCFTGSNGRIKQQESSGLGLYIAKNILDYLGHDIKMTSEVGKGTTFQIYMRYDNQER